MISYWMRVKSPISSVPPPYLSRIFYVHFTFIVRLLRYIPGKKVAFGSRWCHDQNTETAICPVFILCVQSMVPVILCGEAYKVLK